MLKKGWFIRCRCFWASFCFSTGHSTPALRYKKIPPLSPLLQKQDETWRELFDPGLFQQAIHPKPTNSIKGEHHTSHPLNCTSFPECAQCCLPGEVQHIPNGIAAFPDRRNDDDRHQHTGKSDVSQRLRFSVRFFISAAQNGI